MIAVTEQAVIVTVMDLSDVHIVGKFTRHYFIVTVNGLPTLSLTNVLSTFTVFVVSSTVSQVFVVETSVRVFGPQSV